MKAITTLKSPDIETLCALYAELLCLRREVHRLEYSAIHIQPDKHASDQTADQARRAKCTNARAGVR